MKKSKSAKTNRSHLHGKRAGAKLAQPPLIEECLPASFLDWFPEMVERVREAGRLATAVQDIIASQKFKLDRLHDKGLVLPDWENISALIWMARGSAGDVASESEKFLNRLFLAAFDARRAEAGAGKELSHAKGR